MKTTGRDLGCLLGGALGDAFGYAVEFDSMASIRRRFGPGGIVEPVLDGGRLIASDDTQMTLFTLEGLQRAGDESPEAALASIRRAYLDWFSTQQRAEPSDGAGWLCRQPVMRARRAPGNTCLSALASGGNGTFAVPANDSKGCGGVMRVAPIGLVQRWSPSDAFRLAAQAAAITHGHLSGFLSAGAMAAMVRLLVSDAGFAGAARAAIAILAAYYGNAETAAALRNAISLAESPTGPHPDTIRRMGEGWVGEEALAIAVYSVLRAGSFVEAVRIAANHDGDSDSTASIAGQLWGAAHGTTGMPQAWIDALDLREPLFHLAGAEGAG